MGLAELLIREDREQTSAQSPLRRMLMMVELDERIGLAELLIRADRGTDFCTNSSQTDADDG